MDVPVAIDGLRYLSRQILRVGRAVERLEEAENLASLLDSVRQENERQLDASVRRDVNQTMHDEWRTKVRRYLVQLVDRLQTFISVRIEVPE